MAQQRRRPYYADVVEEYDPEENDDFYGRPTQSVITTQRRSHPLPSTGQHHLVRSSDVPARATRTQTRDHYEDRVRRSMQPTGHVGKDVRNLPAKRPTTSVAPQKIQPPPQDWRHSQKFTKCVVWVLLGLIGILLTLSLLTSWLNSYMEPQPQQVTLSDGTEIIAYADSHNHIDTFIVPQGNVQKAKVIVGPEVEYVGTEFDLSLKVQGDTVIETVTGPRNLVFAQGHTKYDLVKDSKGNYNVQKDSTEN